MIADQLSPPSSLRQTPLPDVVSVFRGSFQRRRVRCHVDAYTTSGFVGSSTRSMAPASSLTESTWSQDSPPSRVLYTPRSGLVVHSLPDAAT